MKCNETFRSVDYTWGFDHCYQYSQILHPFLEKHSIQIHVESASGISVQALQDTGARNS